ncbi:hypothetical protein GCM10010440_67790 [Kitasatospora cinereorecta]
MDRGRKDQGSVRTALATAAEGQALPIASARRHSFPCRRAEVFLPHPASARRDAGSRNIEERHMSADCAVGLLIAAALVGYLILAVRRPDKF